MSGTAEQSGQALNPCAHDPYPGLRPYEENEQDQFFGRDADTQILLDKILTHRLTLLFAATGVGKSSLLKAAVIPKLKAASGKHLDVVYYNDWVTAPLAGLKADIARTVQQSANWPPGTVLDESLSLVEFVQFCTLFVRPPLVIMLDQFEELFRYRNKYHKDTFKPFIEELTGLITATQIPVSIVFSMREDFALELNAFKPKLPTLLFENYYRLERLPAGAARQAIVEPLRPLRFAYEPELLEQLVQDLLKHDPDRDLSSLGADDEVETVIPPQLQIVCSQLWQMEGGNEDRLLHLSTYEGAGRAQGLLKNYVEKALRAFSEKDRRILSRAFDHLVSIQGTKMPHTVATLAERISYNVVGLRRFLWQKAFWTSPAFREKLPNYIKKLATSDPKFVVVLQTILEKLASPDVRILRSQRREQQTWYELYHDMYSEGINAWNRVQKRKMLWRQMGIWGTAISATGLVAFFGTVAYVHSVSHHLRLAPGDNNRVEIFTGKQGWVDPFGQKGFYTETDLFSREIETDKRFIERGILDYQNINTDLIAYQPLEERISAYIQGGTYSKALELFNKTIAGNNVREADSIANRIFGLKTHNGFLKIKALAISEEDANINRAARTLFEEDVNLFPMENLDGLRIFQQILASQMTYRLNLNSIKASPLLFYKLLTHLQSPHRRIRSQAAIALGTTNDRTALAPLISTLRDIDNTVRASATTAIGLIGDHAALPKLFNMLEDSDAKVRGAAVKAIGLIGDSTFIPQIISALGDNNQIVQLSAIEALGLIGGNTVLPQLINVLRGGNEHMKRLAAEALGQTGSSAALPSLVDALGDENQEVRLATAIALGKIGDSAILPQLIKALMSDNEFIQQSAANVLWRIGDPAALPQLINSLEDDNEEVQRFAAMALGRIGDHTALPYLINLLDDDNESVRAAVAEALGKIGDNAALPQLVNALRDSNEYVRANAALALGKMNDRTVIPQLINMLKDRSEQARSSVFFALGQFGDRSVLQQLVNALKDESEQVKLSAVFNLEKIGDRSTLPQMINMLEDNSQRVRRAVTQALEIIGGISKIKFKRQILMSATNENKKNYRWADFSFVSQFDGHLSRIYGTREHRQQFLVGLNLPILEARDQVLLQLAENIDAHTTIREKAIEILAKEGVDKKQIIAKLHSLNPTKVSLKLIIETALTQLTEKTEIPKALKYSSEDIPQLKDQLAKLEQAYSDWRVFRDSKTGNSFIGERREERWDAFLQKVQNKKSAIEPQSVFDNAEALAQLDPSIGLELLRHPLAGARQGAYTAFMMKANIEWLQKLDHAREQHRDDPIFCHAAFRAIDLGLWRLEVLGNKDNNDKEYKELMAWQKKLEADQSRKAAHKDADDPDDEVLERLQWTTMMMKHTKKMTAKFAKDGWVRDWPENALPVNQPYPDLK